MPGGAPTREHPVLLYDGQCALCDGSVRAVLAADRGARFRFAALGSAAAAERLAAVPAPAGAADSVVLLAGGRAWLRSSAVVRALFALGFPWSWLGALVWLVPRPLRDALYDAVAARRSRWFGRLERCRLPSPAERARFLDAGERDADGRARERQGV